MILSLFPRALLTDFLLVFILYRPLQKKLANSNRTFTSAVIRVPALTEEPALKCVKTLYTSSTAHAPWGISEEQHLAKNSCRETMELTCQLFVGFDPANNSVYEVFCDFTSEMGFVWTLIESFSLAIMMNLRIKHFTKTIP